MLLSLRRTDSICNVLQLALQRSRHQMRTMTPMTHMRRRTTSQMTPLILMK